MAASSKLADASSSFPVSEEAADTVLTRLHTTATTHRVPLPSAILLSVATLLKSPTAPASTISAVLTALCQLPPAALPPNQSSLLAPVIATAADRARAVLNPVDLRHAAHLIAQLAARSDSAAIEINSSGTVGILFHAASAAAAADPALREALRQVAVVTGLSADEFRTLLSSSHASFRSRAEKLVAAATNAYRRPVRILAIDGGGTRAVLALQILKRIELLTGTSLRSTFDIIGGTSTGGILAVAAGILGKSLQQVEDLYTQFAHQVFSGKPGKTTSSGIYHAGKVLLLNKGVYNSRVLQRLYETHCGPGRLFEHAGGHGTPRVFVLSTQIRARDRRVRTPRPFLHANYRGKGRPRYAHGCWHRLSEALRATTAAPVYFDAFVDAGGEAFCDGGVLMNNPTSVAIHEARYLWPGRPLGVVVSVGTGSFSMNVETQQSPAVTLLKKDETVSVSNIVNRNSQVATDSPEARRRGSMAIRVAQAVLDSATDTESIHHTLEDLLGKDGVYFRLNPHVPGEQIMMDEYRPEVLAYLRNVGIKYSTDGSGAEVLRKLCRKLDQNFRYGLNGYGMWLTKTARSYARL